MSPSARLRRPEARPARGGAGSYLPEAGVDGADEHAERLAGAAAHGSEHLAQEGDEAQPALHVLLLQRLPHREVLLRRHKTPCQPGGPRRAWGGAWEPLALLWCLRAKGWSGATSKPCVFKEKGMGDL